jgi:D-3-phosphoglycerate dehydrogenase
MRILVTAPHLEPEGRALLEDAGATLDFVRPAGDAAALRRALAAAPHVGVISRSIPIRAAEMDLCPTLRVISRAATGHDVIDVAAATLRGIAVMVAAGANAVSVAEHTIGLMLAAARHIPAHDARSRAGGWDRQPLGLELAGRTLGLVGFGQIGQRVGSIAAAMGLRLLAWSPSREASGAAPPLDQLFALADIVSLHVPLTPGTRHIVDARRLQLMKREAILVNTGRGALVEEAALAAALQAGHLHGAALDVLSAEPPPPGHALLAAPRLILTPHMGGATTLARAATGRAAAAHALDVLLGRSPPPGACVNPAVLARHPAGA